VVVVAVVSVVAVLVVAVTSPGMVVEVEVQVDSDVEVEVVEATPAEEAPPPPCYSTHCRRPQRLLSEFSRTPRLLAPSVAAACGATRMNFVDMFWWFSELKI
jgi:hypothetical protein